MSLGAGSVGSTSAHAAPREPPSSPTGPRNSTNFSRRKLPQPEPPEPERMVTLARSRNFMAWSRLAQALAIAPCARRIKARALARTGEGKRFGPVSGHLAQIGPGWHGAVTSDRPGLGVADILEPGVGQDAGRDRVVLKHLGED